jgi:hypothetical protein
MYYYEKALPTTVLLINHVHVFLLFFLLSPTLSPPPPPTVTVILAFGIFALHIFMYILATVYSFELPHIQFVLYHVPTGSFQPLHTFMFAFQLFHKVKIRTCYWLINDNTPIIDLFNIYSMRQAL